MELLILFGVPCALVTWAATRVKIFRKTRRRWDRLKMILSVALAIVSVRIAAALIAVFALAIHQM